MSRCTRSLSRAASPSTCLARRRLDRGHLRRSLRSKQRKPVSGHTLTPDARELLARANGWVRLAGRFTLLSCEEIGGPEWAELLELRDIFFDSCPREVWPRSVADPRVLIPIIVVPSSPETIYVFPSGPGEQARPALNTGLDPIPESTLKQAIEESLAELVADLNALANGSVAGATARASELETRTPTGYSVGEIRCPSPDEVSKALNLTTRPLVTRQQGATEVSCLVEIPRSYMFSMLSFKNRGQLCDSVLPVLEEQAQMPSDRSDGRTTSSTFRPIDGIGDEAYEMTTRFDDTNEVFHVVVWSRTGSYRVKVSGYFPDRDSALSAARLWVKTQPTQ